MPNRTHEAFGGGWAWQPNEEHLCFTPEQLLDCYIRSVGRNSNLLLGMAISKDGVFQDEEQFGAFGSLIRKTFGTPKARLTGPVLENARCTLTLEEKQPIRYVVIREDIREGQRIRAFRLLADGKPIYAGECVGHKRIVPFEALTARTLTLEIVKAVGTPALRDFSAF